MDPLQQASEDPADSSARAEANPDPEAPRTNLATSSLTFTHGQHSAFVPTPALAAQSEAAQAAGKPAQPPAQPQGQQNQQTATASEEPTVVAPAQPKRALEFIRTDPEYKLVVNQVVLNGTHILRTFNIHNLSEHHLRLHLSSTLGKQISFQLENENIRHGILVDSSDANELFNFINLIDQMQLAPYETRQVIVGFLPELKDYENATSRGGADDHDQQQPAADEDAEDYDRFLSIRARINIKVFITEPGLDDAQPPCSETAPAFIHSIKFRASLCRSIMHVEPIEQDLSFENCIVNRTMCKDFTVWNQSEIPLSFSVILPSIFKGSETLKFMVLDTGEELSEHTILGFANARIRVVYKPSTAGEMKCTAHLCNSHNPSNQIPLSIHATVSATRREMAVEVTPAVDFGDCFIGQVKSETIQVKNITDTPIELFLNTGLLEGITFHMHSRHTKDAAQSLDDSMRLNTSDILTESPGRRAKKSDAVKTEEREEESLCSELLLMPGKVYLLDVKYRPTQPLNALNSAELCRLARQSFRISLTASMPSSGEVVEMKTLHCRSRICASRVKLSTHLLDFGDVRVGTSLTKSIEVSFYLFIF